MCDLTNSTMRSMTEQARGRAVWAPAFHVWPVLGRWRIGARCSFTLKTRLGSFNKALAYWSSVMQVRTRKLQHTFKCTSFVVHTRWKKNILTSVWQCFETCWSWHLAWRWNSARGKWRASCWVRWPDLGWLARQQLHLQAVSAPVRLPQQTPSRFRYRPR